MLLSHDDVLEIQMVEERYGLRRDDQLVPAGHRTEHIRELRNRDALGPDVRVGRLERGIFKSVPVIDRGPYARTASWDLTAAAARGLGLSRTARLRVIH